MSADEIAEMGRRAKKRVAEEYTWDKICKQYESVFTEEIVKWQYKKQIKNAGGGGTQPAHTSSAIDGQPSRMPLFSFPIVTPL